MAVDCLDQHLLCDGRMCSVMFYAYLMGLEIAFSSFCCVWLLFLFMLWSFHAVNFFLHLTCLFSFIFPFSSSSICFCSILSSPFSSFSNFCPSDMLLMFSFPTSPIAHSIPLLVLPSFYSRLQVGSSKGPKPVVMQ